MKTLKRSLAILLSVIMVFSTFAFVIFASAEGEAVTVDVAVNPPQATKKADTTFTTNNEKFVPGNLPYLTFALANPGTNYGFDEFGGVPSEDQVLNVVKNANMPQGGTPEEIKAGTALCDALLQVIKNGIAWVEYDINEYHKLVDGGVLTEEELDNYLKNNDKNDLILGLLSSSSEFGLSFANCFDNEKAKDVSSTAKYLKPGDSFKEGKSYACCFQICPNINIEGLKSAVNALAPYCEKKADIKKKLETASEDERVNLNNELENLDITYEKELNAFMDVADDLYNAENEGYSATINGKDAEEIGTELGMFWTYDFGEAAKKPTIIDMIKDFFRNIIEFIKNLFNFKKA
ncbi:MAG: hypothetical protein IJM02_03150 [Clostridia bacterium]|nr:hypothetical protein [Clostridia bacterium]